MSRTNKERVLDYIWAVSPAGATNSQIRQGTGISSHQQVYLLTRELAGAGQIRGERRGRESVFWVDESVGAQLSSPGRVAPGWMHAQTLTPQAFAELACSAMSAHLDVPLAPGTVAGVPWAFDLVSLDNKVIGCTLYYTCVQGQRLPSAKFSLITERVWLLEQSGAPFRFLVFGNDCDVPVLWLERYRNLVPDMAFYYLSDEGMLEELNEGTSVKVEVATE